MSKYIMLWGVLRIIGESIYGSDYERKNNPGGTRQRIFNGRCAVFYVTHESKLWELRQIAAVDNLHKDLRMQDQIAEKVQVGSKKVIHIRKNDFKAKSDL